MEANGNGSKQEDPSLEALFNQLMAEKEGLVPKGFAQDVERDLTGNGKYAIARRLAMVFLEKPYKEIVAEVERDRDFAVAAAHVSEVLRGNVEAYKLLAQWLDAASNRLCMAIAIREDMDGVIRDAKASGEAARDELQRARFLRSLKDRK